jgi:hypothetical protein
MPIKVLYNNCYGPGFTFSNAFIAEYEAKTGQHLDTISALFCRGSDSIRCDPVAIAIVEERGSAWCSGPESEIAIYEVNDVFARYWEIESNDGDEYVRVLVSEALADVLHTFMETNDRAALDRQYRAIMNTRVLKTEAEKDADAVYSYFG